MKQKRIEEKRKLAEKKAAQIEQDNLFLVQPDDDEQK